MEETGNMRKITLLAVVVLALAGLVFPVAAQEGNIVDVAAGNENFSSLVAAVLAADPAIRSEEHTSELQSQA